MAIGFLAIGISAVQFHLSVLACSHPELITRKEQRKPASQRCLEFNPSSKEGGIGLFLTLNKKGLAVSTGTLTAALYVRADGEKIFIEPYSVFSTSDQKVGVPIFDPQEGDLIYAATFGPDDASLGRSLIILHQASQVYNNPQVGLEIASQSLKASLHKEIEEIAFDSEESVAKQLYLIVLKVTKSRHVRQMPTDIKVEPSMIEQFNSCHCDPQYDLVRKTLIEGATK